MVTLSYHDVAKMLDHGLLRPGTTEKEFEAGIDEALEFNVASVCIQPHYLARLVERLQGSSVFSSTVIGFPHGATTPTCKLWEAREALELGCQELDVVLNIGRARGGDLGYVRDELGPVIESTHAAGQKVKVILETALLDDETKKALCLVCADLGADWVKTSTGFAAAGATSSDVALLRANSPPRVGVKASGGIRSLNQLLEMKTAGADRIGTSSTRAILNELASA